MKLIHELVTVRINMVHTDAVTQEQLTNTIHGRVMDAVNDLVRQYAGNLMSDPVTVRLEQPVEVGR